MFQKKSPIIVINKTVSELFPGCSPTVPQAGLCVLWARAPGPFFRIEYVWKYRDMHFWAHTCDHRRDFQKSVPVRLGNRSFAILLYRNRFRNRWIRGTVGEQLGNTLGTDLFLGTETRNTGTVGEQLGTVYKRVRHKICVVFSKFGEQIFGVSGTELSGLWGTDFRFCLGKGNWMPL